MMILATGAAASSAMTWRMHRAAYTAVDRAEDDAETCFAVDYLETRALA